MRTDNAGGEIAQSGAYGNGQVKEAQDAIAFDLGIEVGEQRGREDAEGRFADPHDGVAKIQRVVAVHGCREQGEQAPKHGPGDQQRLAWKTIAEPAGQRRGDHVSHEEGVGQRPHLLVVDAEFLLHQGLHSGQNVAIKIVEEVQAGQQQ